MIGVRFWIYMVLAYCVAVVLGLPASAQDPDVAEIDPIVIKVKPYSEGVVSGNGQTWDSARNGLTDAIEFGKTRREGTNRPLRFELAVGVYFVKGKGKSRQGVFLPGAPEPVAYTLPPNSTIIGGFKRNDARKETVLSGQRWDPEKPAESDDDAKYDWKVAHLTVAHCKDEGSFEMRNVVVHSGRATKENANIALWATNGGGLYISAGCKVRLVNVVVTGNYATEAGGGIYNAGDLTLFHSTVAGNRAGTTGGGIATADGGTTTLVNSIVAANRSADRMTDDLSVKPTDASASLIESWPADTSSEAEAEAEKLWKTKSLLRLSERNNAPIENRVGFLKSPGLPDKEGPPVQGDLRPSRGSLVVDRAEFTKERIELLASDVVGTIRQKSCDIGAYEYPFMEPREKVFVALNEGGPALFRVDEQFESQRILNTDGTLQSAIQYVKKRNSNETYDDDVDRIWLMQGEHGGHDPLEVPPHVWLQGGFKNLEEASAKPIAEHPNQRAGGTTRISSRLEVADALGIHIDRILLLDAVPHQRLGGGIQVRQYGQGFTSDVTLSQVAIGGCVAKRGGAIWTNAPLTMRHCTIARNHAHESGGGLYIDGNAPVHTDHCVIATNTKSAPNDPAANDEGAKVNDDVVGALDAASQYTFVQTGTDALGLKHGLNDNRVGAPERMVGLDQSEQWFRVDLSPTRMSPVLEIGGPKPDEKYDLAGRPRKQGERVDLGAFEYPFESFPKPKLMNRLDILPEKQVYRVEPNDKLKEALKQVIDSNSDSNPDNDIVEVRLQGDVYESDEQLPMIPFVAFTSESGRATIKGSGGLMVPPMGALNVQGAILRYIRLLEDEQVPDDEQGPVRSGLFLHSTPPLWPTSVQLFRCRFEGWRSSALHIEKGVDADVWETEFVGNHFVSNGKATGGAIHLEAANLYCANCTFVNNSAEAETDKKEDQIARGGAIYSRASTLTLSACTFTRNKVAAASVAQGAAIAVVDSTGEIADFRSCTIVENECPAPGGAVYADKPVRFSNTILAETKGAGPSVDLTVDAPAYSEDFDGRPDAAGNFVRSTRFFKDGKYLPGPVPTIDEPEFLARLAPLGYYGGRAMETMPPLWGSQMFLEVEKDQVRAIGAADRKPVIPFLVGEVIRDGAPVSGEVVTLNTEPTRQTISDASGRYLFRGVPYRRGLEVRYDDTKIEIRYDPTSDGVVRLSTALP